MGRAEGLTESVRLGADHAKGGDLGCHLKKHFGNVVFEGRVLVGNQKLPMFGTGLQQPLRTDH